MPNLFAAPPERTPMLENGALSKGWIQWLQSVAKIFSSTSTTATAGTSGALPATVQGYLILNINGTQYKIPYYKP